MLVRLAARHAHRFTHRLTRRLTRRSTRRFADRLTAPAAAPIAGVLVACALLLGASGCRDASSAPTSPMERGETSRADVRARGATDASPAARPGAVGETLVIVLGDSLSAGFRLPSDEAFPALMERALRDEGRAVRVLNAGVSGDTSAGGVARLDWLLAQHPDVLVVELGGNDGLRGLPVAQTRRNLQTIAGTAQAAGAAVLLLGMRLPPNLGPEYTRDFAALYPSLADELDVPLVPFLLEGVAGRADLNLPDGIHPNREGQKLVARNVLPALRELLDTLVD
jgi:acyl-CoA thioesterase-1